MVTYIVRRLLWSILLLFVVSFITFVMFILLPSADPAILRAGRQPTPELIAAIRENLGLDKPWYVQYLVYMRDLLFHFDFGYSYQNNVAVRETLFDRLPATASLALGGAVVWLLIGIPIGIISAIKRGANLLDVMGEDYIRTARAKGLNERKVVFKHGLRSAITPIVTIFGLDLGILFGGAILTETVFNIPGF